jgi:hypothetical protein
MRGYFLKSVWLCVASFAGFAASAIWATVVDIRQSQDSSAIVLEFTGKKIVNRMNASGQTVFREEITEAQRRDGSTARVVEKTVGLRATWW